MASATPPPYPPSLTDAELTHLITTVKDYSLSHGLAVRPAPSFSPDPYLALSTPAPISLFPAAYPRSSFSSALAAQLPYNALYARIASDHSLLNPVVAELAKVDSFISGLYSLHRTVEIAHEYELGLFRSDYMLHQPGGVSRGGGEERKEGPPAVHQVEFNTIASSFGGLASRVSELHRFLASAGAYPEHAVLQHESIPLNYAAEGLAAGLAAADEVYRSGAAGGDGSRDGTRTETAVLFIVQSGERNVFDQHWLAYPLLEKHGVRSYRLTLTEVPDRVVVDEASKKAWLTTEYLKDRVEISVVYYRAGYRPDEYTCKRDWEARRLLERSKAIKCPSVATQLAGSKKIQQVLASPGVLEQLLPDSPVTVQQLRATFAGIWPLDTSPAGLEARKLAFSHPERFVLKPQREGGGNNIYRHKIPDFLRQVGEEKWSGYILMGIIEVPVAEGWILREGQARKGKVVSELGVYGACIWRTGGEVLVNRQVGWLMRTKGAESEEGGVAAGFGCVDGVALVD